MKFGLLFEEVEEDEDSEEKYVNKNHMAPIIITATITPVTINISDPPLPLSTYPG